MSLALKLVVDELYFSVWLHLLDVENEVFFTLVSFSFVQLSFEKQIRIRKRYCQVTIHNKQHKGDILKCYRIVSHSLFNRTNLIHMNMQLVSSV